METKNAPRPLEGERITFTGTLASMTHRQGQELTVAHGGTATPHISKLNTILVIGEEGWPLEPDGTPSQKLLQASIWHSEGHPIRILKESDWLSALGLADKTKPERHYTPAMLSRQLGVPVGKIRQWHRQGLIQPLRQVFRLPYFDYREVEGVRRLVELLAAGVSRSQITASLEGIKDFIGDLERPLAQLEILSGSKIVYRDRSGPLDPRSGQRLLDFETDPGPELVPIECSFGASDWQQRATSELEAGEIESAVHSLRNALKLSPSSAELHFQLAEVLYRTGNAPGSIERFRMACELDPGYIEAYTQMGCVQTELMQISEAEISFQAALALHPEYPDANWYLGELIFSLGRSQEARTYWTRYLEHDTRGPWAEHARMRLSESN